MGSVCRNVTIQIYTHSKTALQSIQKPRQQSGQDLLSHIYKTLLLHQNNGCTVKLYWIPCLEPFLGTKSAESAAKMGTSIQLPSFQQDTARKTTLLTQAKRRLRAENTPLHPSVSKFMQSIDSAVPGNHTNLSYDQLRKDQARIWLDYELENLDWMTSFLGLVEQNRSSVHVARVEKQSVTLCFTVLGRQATVKRLGKRQQVGGEIYLTF